MSVPKTEYEQVYKGTQRRAKQLQRDYQERGYFTRVRRGPNSSFFVLEIAEAKEYNIRKSVVW
jgi:hypothetical protein